MGLRGPTACDPIPAQTERRRGGPPPPAAADCRFGFSSRFGCLLLPLATHPSPASPPAAADCRFGLPRSNVSLSLSQAPQPTPPSPSVAADCRFGSSQMSAPPPVNRLPPPSPGVVADCRFGSSSRIGSPPLPGASVDKMPSNGPFLDLETMGEDCGDGASWWKGRGWSEIKATMSNPVEHHWKNRREVSKITKRDLCKLFYSRFVR